MSTAIQPPANALTACQKCGECCKRYAISVLPDEVNRQARALKLDPKLYMRIYTQLLVQVVPFSSDNHPLALHTRFIPKILWEKLSAAGFDSEYAMILPMVGFHKKEYCVFFNPQTFGCSIHAVKPEQCSLFPFTSMNENEDYAKAYDFCELSKISSPTKYTNVQIERQRARMRGYFDLVAQKGLEGAWNILPEKGIVIFKGKEMGPLSLPMLNEWLSLARTQKETLTETE